MINLLKDYLKTIDWSLFRRGPKGPGTLLIVLSIDSFAHSQGFEYEKEVFLGLTRKTNNHKGYIDIIIKSPDGIKYAIEIDSSNKKWSLEKLLHAHSIGYVPIWVRWRVKININIPAIINLIDLTERETFSTMDLERKDMTNKLKHVEIYTDGACRPNPGIGGYGLILIYCDTRKEISGGFNHTTNNRMEMYAAIKGLEMLKEACKVTLYSDSKYLVNSMAKGRVKLWRDNNWQLRKHKQKEIANIDLWTRLLALCDIHEVEFNWVKGHDGNPLNERCDILSTIAWEQKDLPADEGYKKSNAIKVNHDNQPYKNYSASDVKITYEGQPCRKCSTPVVKKFTRKNRDKSRRKYWFEYYFHCPNCQTMYMTDEAKRYMP